MLSWRIASISPPRERSGYYFRSFFNNYVSTKLKETVGLFVESMKEKLDLVDMIFFITVMVIMV